MREPWRAGYDAALRLRSSLGWGGAPLPPLRAALEGLGLAVRDADLPPGVACAAARYASADAASLLVSRQRSMSESMQLASALGHLLDLPHGRDFGIASSPWAHWPSVARAKAFAAMLLMPEEAVRDIVRRMGAVDASVVRAVMKQFGTGPIVTTWHLLHLRLVSQEARDTLVQDLRDVPAG